MLKRALRKILLITLCTLQLSCTENVFAGLSSTTTDEGLLNDARTALNIQDYETAIEIITTKMSADGQASVAAKELLAGGYAGRCGLNFLAFLDALKNASTGTAFTITATPFVGVTVDPPSCLLSLETMESIGPSQLRTVSQNLFSAIAGMSLMGSATRFYTDDSPSKGDGSQDSAGISCGLTDAQVDHVILGFGFMAENFSNLGTSQLGANGATFTDLINLCSSLGSSCNVTKATDVTPTLRTLFRKMLNTTEYGVGTYVTSGNPAMIATSCP